LAALVFTLTQPSEHEVKPGSQSAPQLPEMQRRDPFCTAGHSLPQLPQLTGSFPVSAQASPHACPPGHEKLQLPFAHAATPPVGAVHSASQLPQLSGSLAASTSQPLMTLLSQSRKPIAQSLVQVPPLHTVPGHGSLQAPQCRVLLSRFTHSAPLQHVSCSAQSEHGSASPPEPALPSRSLTH
jgi:hypothetical protein